MKRFPHPNNMPISQFFWLQFIQPGNTHELPSSTNWMKLWRYITLELKQSSIWFIPNFNEVIFVKVFQKRWSKGNMERILKGDYAFYSFDDFESITTTLYSVLKKHQKEWLIIKSDFEIDKKKKERVERIANNLKIRVVLIASPNIIR